MSISGIIIFLFLWIGFVIQPRKLDLREQFDFILVLCIMHFNT